MADPVPADAQITDDDHLPWVDCWQCCGDGVTYSCFEEFACLDPEGGCDYCERRCDICGGKGGWRSPDAD